MAWTKVDQSIRDHRKIYDLSDALDISVALTIGLLVCLWLWAMDNTTSGSLDGISARTIARAAKWEKDPEQLLAALIAARFVDIDNAGRKYLHDWAEYEGKYISEREREKERSQSRRDRQRVSEQQSTTGRTVVDQKTADGRQDEIRYEQSRLDKSRADQSAAASSAPLEKIVALYNDICIDLPKIYKITQARQEAISECWAGCGKLDCFEELFRSAQSSSFLTGNNDRGWRADLDWLIQPANMTKVLEGKYTNYLRAASTLDTLATIIQQEENHD